MKILRKNGPEPALIFIHIPRAGGTTLEYIIRSQYEKNAIYRIDAGRHDPRPIEAFKNLPNHRKDKIKVLMGHIPFGLGEYLPQPCVYTTMLRDPIDRMISLYYYILRRPNHRLYDTLTSKKISLRDFASIGLISDLENGQTRFLNGMQEIGTHPPSGLVSQEQLEKVKTNIREDFLLAGLADRFDESLMILKKGLGWTNTFYTRRNVTENRPRLEDIPKETVRAIEKYNEMDVELYRFAKEIFDGLVRREGTSFFKIKVDTFHLENKLYNRFEPYIQRPWRASINLLVKIKAFILRKQTTNVKTT